MTPSEISHAVARVPQEVYQAALDRALKAEMDNARLRNALSDLMETHEEDIGMDDFRDEESVGTEYSPDGKTVVDMKLTFGVLRRARQALSQ